MRAPSLPAQPWTRSSAIRVTEPQHGHSTPLALIVPAPRVPSCARFCAAEPDAAGTSVFTPKTTPPSPASMVSRTRLPGFLHSQRVLSSGISARQPPHSAVRAHRYATTGFATQRGLASSFR